MAQGQEAYLYSLATTPYSYPSPEEETDEEEQKAVIHFQRRRALVEKLEAEYLERCATAGTSPDERDLARKRCVKAQEDLDELRTHCRGLFPTCHFFMGEDETDDNYIPRPEAEEDVVFRPVARDFVDAMAADLKELAMVVNCDWRVLLPKAISDLQRAWEAHETFSQPVGLTWSEVRDALVREYDCTPSSF